MVPFYATLRKEKTIKTSRLFPLTLVLILLVTLTGAAGSTPLSGPCVPGATYDPACDADHDGDGDIFDIQLTAGHWSQSGTFTSDNNHNHLGQTWTGSIKLTGSYGAPDYAALVLSNSSYYGLMVQTAGRDGVRMGSAGDDGVHVYSAGNRGVWVGEAGSDGVHVGSAGGHGVYVNRAGQDGVHASSVSATYYGGRFRNGANRGFKLLVELDHAIRRNLEALTPSHVLKLINSPVTCQTQAALAV